MTQIDVPLIDVHTHIGTLPGAVGDIYYPEDLVYIAEHEGARFMLTSSASVTTIGRQYGMAQALDMVKRFGDRLGGMLWINPHDPAWRDDVPAAVESQFYGIKIHPQLDNYAVTREALDEIFACAREHHWPILTHTGQDRSPISAQCYAPLIEAYPDIVLILAHLSLEAIPWPSGTRTCTSTRPIWMPCASSWGSMPWGRARSSLVPTPARALRSGGCRGACALGVATLGSFRDSASEGSPRGH